MPFGRRNAATTEHEYVEERLSPYLDGELSPQEQDVVVRHLASCSDCQWNLETLRQTVQWTRELSTVPVPRVFTIPAPAVPERAPRVRRGWGLPLLQGATALVAVLLLFVVAGDLLMTGFLPGGQPEPAVMRQQAPAGEATQALLEAEPPVAADEAQAPEAAVAEKVVLEAEVAVEEVAPLPTVTLTPTPVQVEALVTEAAALAAPEAAPAEGEVVGEGVPTQETMGTMGMELPAAGEPAVEAEATTVTAPAPPAGAGETRAAVTEDVAVTEVASPEPEPTVTQLAVVVPTLASSPTPTLPPPTVVALVPEPAVERSEPSYAGTDDLVTWFGVAEIGLVVLFFLLATTTVILMIRRRTG